MITPVFTAISARYLAGSILVQYRIVESQNISSCEGPIRVVLKLYSLVSSTKGCSEVQHSPVLSDQGAHNLWLCTWTFALNRNSICGVNWIYTTIKFVLSYPFSDSSRMVHSRMSKDIWKKQEVFDSISTI